MKRTLSMLIVAVMVIATFAAALPAQAIADVPVSEVVEAPYFDVKPNIDGIVSEAEWGNVSVIVDQSKVGNAIVLAETDSPEYNEYNTFFYRNPGAKVGYNATALNMSYRMWVRWDENYFYIAVKVSDPDGHSLKNGKRETWNGDAVQFRLDPEGYNAVTGGFPDYYDAELDGKPWSAGDIDDICMGYVQAAGGFTEAWNNAAGGDGVGMTSYSGGDALVAVVPTGANYSSDSASYTTYEAAIPWHYIDSYSHEYSNYSYKTPNGAIGREYGMSAVVYNADGTSGAAQYNAGLAWGSGIINAQQNFYPKTCGGSNPITLSDEKVSEHSTHSDTFESGAGYVAPRSVPDYPLTIDESNHTVLDYETEDDMYILGSAQNGEWVAEDGNAGNHVARWDKSNETESGLNENNYLSTIDDIEQPTFTPADCSYTMEFDVKVLGTETFAGGYNSALYNWFGGARTYEYMCGYAFNLGKFILQETDTSKMIDSAEGTFTLNEWHHVVFQYYRANSEMRYYFDPEMKDGHVAPTATPIFSRSYRYFDTPGLDSCQIILRRMNCQILLDNVQYYNFVDWTQTGERQQEVIPGGGGGGQTQPKEETSEIETNVIARDDGTFAIAIPNEKKYSASGVKSVTFTIDLKKAEGKLNFKGVEGVDEAALEIKDNGDGTITITVKDLKIFAKVEEGKDVMSLIFEPADGATLSADDVKNFVTVKSTVSSVAGPTGDKEVAYIAGALVLAAVIAISVAVITKKRRSIDF
ncbi:MAG: hypothetical protein IKN38_09790 [Clostridia bacterium]|nr:hypothetical protein [Clostridia bacterium]